MKKIAISGANSFIGSQLVNRANEEGWEVIGIVRPGAQNPILSGTIKFIELPLEDYRYLGNMVGYCDCFIHFAWAGTIGTQRMDRDLQKKNVVYSIDGITSLLDAGCTRVLTVGSQAEYGSQSTLIREEDDCHPYSEYGKCKLELTKRTFDLCKKMHAEYREPRLFSVYGPNDHPHTMIMQTLKKMLCNEPCYFTEAIQKWDFLYISDAVEAIWKLCSDDCPDGSYNIGNGDIRPLRQFILEMADITRTVSDLKFGALAYPEGEIVSIQPDVSKIRDALGWTPQVSFRDGIYRLVNWLNKSESL